MIKTGQFVCLSVCPAVRPYPSSAHDFGLIGMKLGMDTLWDPGGDMRYVRLRFAASALCYKRSVQRVKGVKNFFLFETPFFFFFFFGIFS